MGKEESTSVPGGSTPEGTEAASSTVAQETNSPKKKGDNSHASWMFISID